MSSRLLIIGGAAGPALLGRFVELAGGSAARIVVIATASRRCRPRPRPRTREAFTGSAPATCSALRLTARADANDAAVEPVLRAATGSSSPAATSCGSPR